MRFCPRAHSAERLPANTPIGREPLFTLTEVAPRLSVTYGRARQIAKDRGIRPVFGHRPSKYRLSDFQRALNIEAQAELYKVQKGVPIPPREQSALRKQVAKLAAQLRSMEFGDRISIPDKGNSSLLVQVRKEMPAVLLISRKDEKDPTVRWVWKTQR